MTTPRHLVGLLLVAAVCLVGGSAGAQGAASGKIVEMALERTVGSDGHSYELTAVLLNTSFGAPGALEQCQGCPRGCTPLRISVAVTNADEKLVMYKWTEPRLCVAEQQTETFGFGESERCFAELRVVVSLEPSGGGLIADQNKQTFSFPCASRLIAPLAKLEDLDVEGKPPTFFKSTVERTTRPISSCFGDLVAKAPGLGGTIRVAMVVGTDRSVSGVRTVENSTGSDDLAGCVTDAIGKLRIGRGPQAEVKAVATFSYQSE